MALSDELEKISSERYALVKIIPSFKLNTFLSVKSGTIYEASFAFGYELSSIKVDGVSYTESTSTNPTSAKYYWNQSTNVFEINMGVALASQEIVFDHILRFTDSDYSVFDENGVKNAVSSYFWEPRLLTAPTFAIDIKNALVGIPTISSTRFRLTNNDLFLNQFLSGENSFYNKKVFISLFINGTIYAKYEGKTKKAVPSDDSVSFTVYDTSSNLNNACLMGDNSDEAYYNFGQFANLDERAEDKIIPYVIGQSAFAYVETATAVLTGGDFHFRFDTTKTSEAVCINTTNSRDWGLCRSGIQGHKETDYGDANDSDIQVSSSLDVDYGTGGFTRRSFIMQITHSTHNIKLLDTIEIVKSSTTYQGIVTNIRNSGDDFIAGYLTSTSAPAGPFYDNVNPNPNDSVGLMVQQGSEYFFMESVNDYLFLQTTLTNGNRFYKVQFNSGFESNHPGMATLNYLTDKVFYRFTEDTATVDETTHGYAVRRILEASGTTVVSTAIPVEGNPAGSNVSMMIPKLGETKPKKFSDYIGDIMRSAFGYIYQDNSSLEMNYRLWTAPSAVNIVLKEEIINLKIVLDGNDMAKDIKITNDNTYYFYTTLTDATNTKTSSAYLSSNKSVYLHGLNNSKSDANFVMMKTNIREAQKKSILENEQMYVTFSVSMKYANLNIGDDISLEDVRIPGDKTTVDGIEVTPLKIIGIRNSPELISFTCVDLKGI